MRVKKKVEPPSGGQKDSSLPLDQKFCEIFRKKILPCEGDGKKKKKKKTAPIRSQKKNSPLLQLPTPTLEI